MKALSQSEYGELRSLYESVYAPKFESILDEFTDEDLDDLTDEYIEEQVTEFFQECLEEGLDIEILEETICESIDASLDILIERVNPAETQRRRDQAKDRLETGRAMKSAAEKSSPKPSLKVSRAKVGGSSEKKASALSRIKGAVKKVGKAVQGGVGLATRAVGTAQRAGSAVKSAAKKGYERGRQGSGGGASSSSSSTSSASDGESSSSETSSSSGGGSSAAPKKRKDGLLKRGLKKLVRGVGKAVSVGAGAVKAGADYAVSRARKEELELDQMIESLVERGHTEQEAYALVAQFTLDEAITSEKGKAKAAEMIAKRSTPSGRAKSGQGASVAQIKHISRANVDNLGGTPPNPKIAKNPVKSRSYGGTGNKAARRAAALRQEDVEFVDESQEARNNPEKYEREQSKKYAPVRGEKTPMPPRGDKRREDFEKWYAAQRR